MLAVYDWINHLIQVMDDSLPTSIFSSDGSGMLANILFAWSKGTLLDIDAKRWRLFADVLNDIAMFLDLLSPLAPPYLFTFAMCCTSVFRVWNENCYILNSIHLDSFLALCPMRPTVHVRGNWFNLFYHLKINKITKIIHVQSDSVKQRATSSLPMCIPIEILLI